ncbi:hypothetical protein HRbin11_02437 [bacterium HR11]|nr:hypothetical protein HRbin11_02437 [bacterium HR11]
MKRVGRQVGPVLAFLMLMTMACGGDGDGLPTAPPPPPARPRLYVIQVSRCEGTYDWTLDFGVIVGCEVGNSGSACGYTTVRLSVEQAGVIMDQTTRSVYVCPGDKVYVEETLWGARDGLPYSCQCQIL